MYIIQGAGRLTSICLDTGSNFSWTNVVKVGNILTQNRLEVQLADSPGIDFAGPRLKGDVRIMLEKRRRDRERTQTNMYVNVTKLTPTPMYT